jgi:hypothetical protein
MQDKKQKGSGVEGRASRAELIGAAGLRCRCRVQERNSARYIRLRVASTRQASGDIAAMSLLTESKWIAGPVEELPLGVIYEGFLRFT